jgi:hypothetical protein
MPEQDQKKRKKTSIHKILNGIRICDPNVWAVYVQMRLNNLKLLTTVRAADNLSAIYEPIV